MCAKKDSKSNQYGSSSSSDEPSLFSVGNSKKAKNQKKNKIQKRGKKRQNRPGRPAKSDISKFKKSLQKTTNKATLIKKLSNIIRKEFTLYLDQIDLKKGLVMRQKQRKFFKKEQQKEEQKPERSIPVIDWDDEHMWKKQEQHLKLLQVTKKFQEAYQKLIFNLEGFEEIFHNVSGIFAREVTNQIYHILMQLYAITLLFPQNLDGQITSEQTSLIKDYAYYILNYDPVKNSIILPQEVKIRLQMSKLQFYVQFPFCFLNKKFTKDKNFLKKEIGIDNLERLLLSIVQVFKIHELIKTDNPECEQPAKRLYAALIGNLKYPTSSHNNNDFIEGSNIDKSTEKQKQFQSIAQHFKPIDFGVSMSMEKENDEGNRQSQRSLQNQGIQKQKNSEHVQIYNHPELIQNQMLSISHENSIVGKSFRVIGMMSGTSLDGIDLSFCQYYKGRVHQQQKWNYRFIAAKTYPYPPEILLIISKMQNNSLAFLQYYECERKYSEHIVETINNFIEQQIKNKTPPEDQTIDLISIHGHTIFHQPQKNLTVQTANLNLIAAKLGIDVIGNFRELDVLRGGNGAPLAPYGEELFEHLNFSNQFLDAKSNTIFLNLGGIANLGFSTNKHGCKQIYGTDIAFCNIMLNHIAQLLNQGSFDNFGNLGRQGKHNKQFYFQLFNYFPSQQFPISLGKQQIQGLLTQINCMHKHSSREDVLSFLAMYYEFLSDKITECIYEWALMLIDDKFGYPTRVLCSGGGTYNAFLAELIMRKIYSRSHHQKVNISFQICPKEILQFKQSIIFGLLGLKCLLGEPNCERGVGGMLVKGQKLQMEENNSKNEFKKAIINNQVKIFVYRAPQNLQERKEKKYCTLDQQAQQCYNLIRQSAINQENLLKSQISQNRHFIQLDMSMWD